MMEIVSNVRLFCRCGTVGWPPKIKDLVSIIKVNQSLRQLNKSHYVELCFHQTPFWTVLLLNAHMALCEHTPSVAKSRGLPAIWSQPCWPWSLATVQWGVRVCIRFTVQTTDGAYLYSEGAGLCSLRSWTSCQRDDLPTTRHPAQLRHRQHGSSQEIVCKIT